MTTTDLTIKKSNKMKEFILLIYAEGNPILSLPHERQQQHIQKIGKFIEYLAQNGKLKNAQPFEPKGITISGNKGVFREEELSADKGDIAGYYHILANDIAEAVVIAKSDPRFEDAEWRMEIRPILKIDGIN